ncbi:MAG: COG2 family protein [Actinomycetota bacterium]|nr:COG2 family protein [Actinomycetota bacterium]
MKEQSLERVNAFLASAAQGTEVGALLSVTPAEIGRDLGFPDPLTTARAVRALIARKRLEPAQGSYRLLDATPVAPGERESVGRAPRASRSSAAKKRPRGGAGSGSARYSDLGRAVVDRLVDLGREVAELRSGVRAAREEARESRQAQNDAEQRARTLAEKVRELEARAEMAESNLRTLLATARTKSADEPGRDARVSDTEMEAILGVLKGDERTSAPPKTWANGGDGPSSRSEGTLKGSSSQD